MKRFITDKTNSSCVIVSVCINAVTCILTDTTDDDKYYLKIIFEPDNIFKCFVSDPLDREDLPALNKLAELLRIYVSDTYNQPSENLDVSYELLEKVKGYDTTVDIHTIYEDLFITK